MKQSVTVNGVQLTRAQVEQALKELNTPEVTPKAVAGERLTYHLNGHSYMVLEECTWLPLQKALWGTQHVYPTGTYFVAVSLTTGRIAGFAQSHLDSGRAKD